MTNLEKKIHSYHNDLSPKLKLASDSILQELKEIPFQTIRKTAKKAGVSVLTILRLNKIWGFRGYSDFQLEVKKEYYNKDNFNDFVQKENILLEKSILKAAKLLIKAENVHIAGFRSAISFASYMNYMGKMVFDNFYLMSDSGLSAAQDLARLKNNSLLVAFSTTPYSTETVKLIKTARSLNIKTLSFTDSSISPLARHSDYFIVVEINKQNKLFNMAPMISVIENVLEKCFEILGDDADKKIDYFAKRIKDINGYWRV